MVRKKIYNFHIKYPIIEHVILFLLGNIIGFVSSLFSSDIMANQNVIDWYWYESLYFGFDLLLLFIGVLYYIFFSSYALNKKIATMQQEEEAFKKVLLHEGKKELKRDIDYELKLLCYERTIDIIHKNDLRG